MAQTPRDYNKIPFGSLVANFYIKEFKRTAWGITIYENGRVVKRKLTPQELYIEKHH